MKTLLAFLVLCSAVLGNPTFRDSEDLIDTSEYIPETLKDEGVRFDNGSGGVDNCGEKPIRLDDDEKEQIKGMVDGLAEFIPAVGKLLRKMEQESKDAMKEFLDKVREGEDREAVRVVGEHYMKMGIKSHRMMGYAFRYANESGLLKDANSPDDIEEGVEDEIEFDDDVLEQAKELVKRAKDGNCDDTYVRLGVKTALSGMQFFRNAWILKQKVYSDIADLVEEVAEELEECNVDQAEKLVGNAVLSYMRRAMKILHKIKQGRPRPSKGPRPSGSPRPTGRPQRTPRPRPSGHPPSSPRPRPSGLPPSSPRPRPSGLPPSSPRPRPSGPTDRTPRPRPSGHPPSSPRPRPSGSPQPTGRPRPTTEDVNAHA